MICGANPFFKLGFFPLLPLINGRGALAGILKSDIAGIILKARQSLPASFDLVLGINPDAPSLGIGFNLAPDIDGKKVIREGLRAGFTFELADEPH